MTHDRWSTDLLRSSPRLFCSQDVETHRIMDQLDRTRHSLGTGSDNVYVSRTNDVCLVADVSTSRRTATFSASAPAIVVSHIGGSDDDDETRVLVAHAMLDITERALVIEQSTMVEEQSHRGDARRLANLIRHMLAAIVGDAWRNPSHVKVRPASPFGPAVASLWTPDIEAETEVTIPKAVIDHHGIRPSWYVGQNTGAEASVILSRLLGVSDDFKPKSHIELMREMAVEGMEELVMSLAECHP